MKKLVGIIVFFALLRVSAAWAQHNLVNQYTGKQYHAHTLMWDITEDAKGFLWFANNEGAVRFDGNNWLMFPTPNPVRSLVVTSQYEVFVACLEDFGVLTLSADGSTHYTSFKDQLETMKLVLRGDEKVFMVDDVVYGSSGHLVFSVTKHEGIYQLKVVDKEQQLGCGVLQHKLFVNHARQGLGTISNGRFSPVQQGSELAGKHLVQTLTFGQQDYIFTNYDGVYVRTNQSLRKVVQGDLNEWAAKGVADVVVVDAHTIAVGTYHNGVKLFNNALQEIAAVELPSPEIYRLGVDHEHNLWVSHLKGLTQVLTGIPVTTWQYPAVSGYINAMVQHQDRIYLSTTNGLFVTTATNPTQLTAVSGISSECWDIQSYQHRLYAATTDGLVEVTGTSAKLLIPNETFLKLQIGNQSQTLYAFAVNGCYRINQQQVISPLPDVNLSANSVFENTDGTLWLGTDHHGLLVIPSRLKATIPEGLRTGAVQLHLIEGRPIAASKDSVYQFEGATLVADEGLSRIWKGNRNRKVAMDKPFWLFTDKDWIGVDDGKPVASHLAYALNGRPTAFLNATGKNWFAVEDRIYWVASGKQPPQQSLRTSIGRVGYGQAGVVFNGVFLTENNEITVTQDQVPEVSHDAQSITIWFGLNSFINPLKNQYRYKIAGWNEQWSEWTTDSRLTLTGLPGGTYTITVEARDALGRIAEPASYTWYIKRPWYLSGIAFMLYLLGLVLLVYGAVMAYNKRLVTQNNELEQRVKERTLELINEKQKSDALLLNILPEGIAEELKNKGFAEAKQYNHVTVLFTDMVNFTGISEQMSPQELVAEIHRNFTAFDGIMEKHGLEKIKTIGDAYLAVSGLPVAHPDHAHRVAAAALDIQQYMEEQTGKFQIRIGIHSGPLVAGIVGVKKYAFDIWGDTVNTAARMEQSSEPGKINISTATYELIKERFTCAYRGKINAKNKGEIDMYFVLSAKR